MEDDSNMQIEIVFKYSINSSEITETNSEKLRLLFIGYIAKMDRELSNSFPDDIIQILILFSAMPSIRIMQTIPNQLPYPSFAYLGKMHTFTPLNLPKGYPDTMQFGVSILANKYVVCIKLRTKCKHKAQMRCVELDKTLEKSYSLFNCHRLICGSFARIQKSTIICNINLECVNIDKKMKYSHVFNRESLKALILDQTAFYKDFDLDKLTFYDDIEKREKTYYLSLRKDGFYGYKIELCWTHSEFVNYDSSSCKKLCFKYWVQLQFDELITDWRGCGQTTYGSNFWNRLLIYPAVSKSMQYESLNRFIPTLKSINLEFQRL